jgi:7-cyano-7-deazaguanine reductase
MNPENSLLGKTTIYPKHYSPDVLMGIARAEGRLAIGIPTSQLPFTGVDIWTHYEVSWLNAEGKPLVAMAEIMVPADSLYLIESKSLKLYFNSLNFERFATEQAFCDRVITDLSAVVGKRVGFRFLLSEELSVADFPGLCLDDIALSEPAFECDASQLSVSLSEQVSERLHSHLLRSLCPVTQQPDWGSVYIYYEGAAIDHAGLLAYLVSYRDHADFHEQCVERIFHDIMAQCQPAKLTVYARYTRRGGLDINPFRTNVNESIPRCRIARQ